MSLLNRIKFAMKNVKTNKEIWGTYSTPSPFEKKQILDERYGNVRKLIKDKEIKYGEIKKERLQVSSEKNMLMKELGRTIEDKIKLAKGMKYLTDTITEQNEELAELRDTYQEEDKEIVEHDLLTNLELNSDAYKQIEGEYKCCIVLQKGLNERISQYESTINSCKNNENNLMGELGDLKKQEIILDHTKKILTSSQLNSA
jgi:chromosome segregation ATPase